MKAMATCIVVISNKVDHAFDDLLVSIRRMCPGADVAWYNTGAQGRSSAEVEQVPHNRPLKYMKIMPAFLDILEWAGAQSYDRVVNVETDLAFIKPGFTEFIDRQMQETDYLAWGLRRRIPRISLWPAYRTLASEHEELTAILGIRHLNRCFNPGQVFGRRYIDALLSSEMYPQLRAFVERNQQPQRSYTLQELLLPSIADSVGVRSSSYPAQIAAFNRFRPYQTVADLKSAQATPDVFFLHPIRTGPGDPVRRSIKELLDIPEPEVAVSGNADSEAEIRFSPIVRAPVNGRSLRGADVSSKDLSDEDLSESMLRGASMVETSLRSTKLCGANLSGAFLSAADLRGADLSMAYLGGAFLGWAMLCDADLSGAYLRGADLREANLRDAFLNGADLAGAFLGDASLEGADLRNANLDGADLREASLIGANLDGASLRGTVLAEARWSTDTRWPSSDADTVRAMSRINSESTFVVNTADSLRLDLRIKHPPS